MITLKIFIIQEANRYYEHQTKFPKKQMTVVAIHNNGTREKSSVTGFYITVEQIIVINWQTSFVKDIFIVVETIYKDRWQNYEREGRYLFSQKH